MRPRSAAPCHGLPAGIGRAYAHQAEAGHSPTCTTVGRSARRPSREATGDWLTLRAKSTFDWTAHPRDLHPQGRDAGLFGARRAGTITPGAWSSPAERAALPLDEHHLHHRRERRDARPMPMRAEGSGTDYRDSQGATIVTPAAAGSRCRPRPGVSSDHHDSAERRRTELVTDAAPRWAAAAFGAGTQAAYEIRPALCDDGQH